MESGGIMSTMACHAIMTPYPRTLGPRVAPATEPVETARSREEHRSRTGAGPTAAGPGAVPEREAPAGTRLGIGSMGNPFRTPVMSPIAST